MDVNVSDVIITPNSSRSVPERDNHGAAGKKRPFPSKFNRNSKFSKRRKVDEGFPSVKLGQEESKRRLLTTPLEIYFGVFTSNKGLRPLVRITYECLTSRIRNLVLTEEELFHASSLAYLYKIYKCMSAAHRHQHPRISTLKNVIENKPFPKPIKDYIDSIGIATLPSGIKVTPWIESYRRSIYDEEMTRRRCQERNEAWKAFCQRRDAANAAQIPFEERMDRPPPEEPNMYDFFGPDLLPEGNDWPIDDMLVHNYAVHIGRITQKGLAPLPIDWDAVVLGTTQYQMLAIANVSQGIHRPFAVRARGLACMALDVDEMETGVVYRFRDQISREVWPAEVDGGEDYNFVLYGTHSCNEFNMDAKRLDLVQKALNPADVH